MLKHWWCPVVILAGTQHQVGPQRFRLHHERTRPDHIDGVAWAEVFAAELQRGVCKQASIVGGSCLRKARGGLAEVEAHRVLIHNLAALVVGDLLRDVKQPLLVAQAVEVKVVHDVLCRHGGAVGIRHVRADIKGEHGCVLVDLRQVRGNPRVQLKRLGILVEQSVCYLVNHAAVGVKAGRRRVQVVKPAGF